MTVTEVTTATLGIGELARLTGVPVRTIRFYCDEGILEPGRSVGGHRRFDRAAVDRLGLVRRLRGLGLGLTAITRVLTGQRSLDEAVAEERAALDVELATLAWRRASLRAVEEATPAERAARLDLLAAVRDGRTAHDTLVAFWRGIVLAPVSTYNIEMFVEVSAPPPPQDPTPAQVVAYAELVAVAGDRSLRQRLLARAKVNLELVADENELFLGIGEACLLAQPLVRAGTPPAPGPALERFVTAHATVRGARDTPAFRRELLANGALDRDPRLRRYWGRVGEVTGEQATVGAAQSWLLDALEADIALL